MSFALDFSHKRNRLSSSFQHESNARKQIIKMATKSTYFDESDEDDKLSPSLSLNTEEILKLNKDNEELKRRGNDAFTALNYDASIVYYTEAIENLKRYKLPPNNIYHLNRAASYLALKSYVKALHDANIAIEIDPNNWKGHWRKGLGNALPSLLFYLNYW